MRKQTPTALKVLKGNPGRRPLPTSEIKPDLELVEPPEGLEGYALEEWKDMAPRLYTLGVLTHLDRASLAAYCQAFGRWRDAEDALREMKKRDPLTSGLIIKTTNGNAIQNPLVGISNKAAMDVVRYAAEFGMTPSARARLGQHGEPNRDAADSFFD